MFQSYQLNDENERNFFDFKLMEESKFHVNHILCDSANQSNEHLLIYPL